MEEEAPLLGQREADNEDDTMIDYIETEGRTSNFQTTMNLLKGSVGVGVLSLPRAVSESGVLVGPILIILTGSLVLYHSIILCEANRHLITKYRKRRLGVAGTIKYAFFPYFPRASRYLAYLINLFIVVYQTGSCAACVLAAAESFRQVARVYISTTRVWVGIFIVPVIILSPISRIDTVSIISFCANSICILSLIGVFAYSCSLVNTLGRYPLYTSFASTLSPLTSYIFAFEGMTSMLPIVNGMEHKNNYARVLCASNAVVIPMYFLVGWIGYLAFGPHVCNPVTLSLPNSNLFNTIKIVYAIGVLFSYLVALFCITTIIMPTLVKWLHPTPAKTFLIELSLKILVVGFGASIAVTLPHFDMMLTLLGAFGSTPISFIIPPLIHVLALAPDRTLYGRPLLYRLILHCFLITLGIGLTAVGIYCTLRPNAQA